VKNKDFNFSDCNLSILISKGMRRSAFTCIVALVIVSLSINIEAQQIDFDTDLETINKKLSE
jgi:hypothetical protein